MRNHLYFCLCVQSATRSGNEGMQSTWKLYFFFLAWKEKYLDRELNQKLSEAPREFHRSLKGLTPLHW